jgi:bifunctional non-homologous end joining protein LigD
MAARREVEVEIEGRRLRLSNLEKVFYPRTGFTKGDVIDYYIRVAPALLPHLRDRPLTLKRYPNGVDAPYFYEKRCPAHRPAWVRTEPVWSRANEDVIDFCVCDDLATLVWAANLADLELHTYLHLAREVARPTMVVFDLDPGAPADVLQCCEVALVLRGLFEALGLHSYPKTSGSKGLQIYVPLNAPVAYDDTKAFARGVAEALEARRPDLVVSSMKKALRAGKVLVDWSQNDDHKTTSCVYSLRAKDRPTVSTPLRWAEVEEALAARDAAPLTFEASAVLARVAAHGDLFAPVLSEVQRLPVLRAGMAARVEAPAGRAKSRGAAGDPPGGAAPPPRPRGAARPARHAKKAGSGGGVRQGTGAPAAGRGGGARSPGRRAPRSRLPSKGGSDPQDRDGYLSSGSIARREGVGRSKGGTWRHRATWGGGRSRRPVTCAGTARSSSSRSSRRRRASSRGRRSRSRRARRRRISAPRSGWRAGSAWRASARSAR